MAVGINCGIVVAAFIVVLAYSNQTFLANVENSVIDAVDLALVGSMQLVRSPLDSSEQLVRRLRDKIETLPNEYGVDDGDLNLSTNPAVSSFLLDGALVVYQREEIQAVFQVRKSQRYQFNGKFTDIVATTLRGSVSLTANNSLDIGIISSGRDVANLTAANAFTFKFPYDASQFSFVSDTYNTSGIRWDAAPFSVSGADVPMAVLLTIYASVNVSWGTPFWGLGIQHNTVAFGEYMLEATAPFSIGITNVNKVPHGDASTSLYEMNRGSLIATSLAGYQLNKTATTLWPAGSTSSSQLNSDYNHATSLCPTSSSCLSAPRSRILGNRIVGAFRYAQSSTSLSVMLVIGVPKEFYFKSANTSLMVSVAVGFVCCLIGIVGSIVLSRLISPALTKLQANMMLAADLKNEQVVHTQSKLSDIAELSSVFDEMNQRLLVARSYITEAVLLGHASGSIDDDDEGSNEDVIDYDHTDKSHRPSGLELSTAESATDVSTPTLDKRTSPSSSNERTKTIAQSLNTISERRVAVLAMNLVGFHSIVSERGAPRPQQVQCVSSALTNIIVNAAHNERGVIDSFHGDHFILTFNASRVVAGPLTAAIRTANVVGAAVRQDATFSGSVGVSAGASVGKALLGTLGVDGYRRLSVVGVVYRVAVGLQGIGAQFLYKTAASRGRPVTPGCTIDESQLKEVSNCGIHLQLIGLGIPTLRAFRSHARPVYNAHHNNGSHSVEEDEWLYELDAIEAGDPFAQPNEALTALMKGDVAHCSQLLAAHQPQTGSSLSHSQVDSANLSSSSCQHGKRHFSWDVVDQLLHSDPADHHGIPPWQHVFH